MSAEVAAWWFSLCAVSALNVGAWVLATAALQRRQGLLPTRAYAVRRLQVLLSAGYVFGCAYRSALPVYDVQRLCLVDSWLSSVIVGRSVATLAELCFVAQWAVMLREVSHATGSGVGRLASKAMLPLIVVAETCSWYSVLTTSNLGHVAEETLWALCAALLVLSLVGVWPRCDAAARRLLGACCALGTAYVLFMFFVDVPMYWSRWVTDEAHGRSYLSLAQGVADASGRWVVTHRWEDWKTEVAWMSLYFSVAVWASISLIHAPVFEPRRVHGTPAHAAIARPGSRAAA